jgi:hypothetical protein
VWRDRDPFPELDTVTDARAHAHMALLLVVAGSPGPVLLEQIGSDHVESRAVHRRLVLPCVVSERPPPPTWMARLS